MSRLLAGIVVIALGGVVIAACASSAPSPRRAPGAVSEVAVTPRLKRLLKREISTLRAGQPRAPLRGGRPSVPRSAPRFVVPNSGVPCFVVGGSPCSEIPCREFASVPRRVASPACTRHAPRRLVLVSGP